MNWFPFCAKISIAMTLNAYLIEDSEGSTYYVAAESLPDAIDLTKKELATYTGQPQLTVNESSAREVNPHEQTFYDETFARNITFAEALGWCAPGVIACSEW